MAQVNNVSTDGILEVQEEIKIRHMNAIVRIQNCFRSWIGLIFGSGRGNDYFYQKLLILKADQQNALEVIFQKVDVDSNNQLDKARFSIMTPSILGLSVVYKIKVDPNININYFVTMKRMKCTTGCTN